MHIFGLPLAKEDSPVLVVEIKGQGQRPLAQFAIFPMPSVAALPTEQYETFAYLAQASGHRYFFLVTTDITFGWRIGSDIPQQPSFKVATVALLSKYADGPTSVWMARETYLAELVQAWLADLATGWKRTGTVPGEAQMANIGLLDDLRAGAHVGYAAP